MTTNQVTCPKCHHQFDLTDVQKEEYEKQLKENEAKLKKGYEAKEEELRTKAAKWREMKEQEFKSKQTEIENQLKIKLEKELADKQSVELKDLKNQLEEKAKREKETQEKELELRKTMRELEEKAKDKELELARKLDEERKKIVEDAKKQADEANDLKLKEHQKKEEMLRKTIEDLKRKSEQGSMQIQGEVQEEDLKKILGAAFPIDSIDDVPTGINGADLIQTVNSDMGQKAGVIVWESKNTKTFSSKWISKLKDDRLKVKADVCILVSQVLPDDIQNFGFMDGVWVCQYKYALQLNYVLRQNLIQVSQVKNSLKGQDEKMNILFNYLSGNQFKSRVENIVSTFTTMKEDLEKERRVMKKHWSKRETEIERIIDNTVGMHGDLQGIMGNALPEVKSLELGE